MATLAFWNCLAANGQTTSAHPAVEVECSDDKPADGDRRNDDDAPSIWDSWFFCACSA
jgi:hypothetical protein